MIYGEDNCPKEGIFFSEDGMIDFSKNVDKDLDDVGVACSSGGRITRLSDDEVFDCSRLAVRDFSDGKTLACRVGGIIGFSNDGDSTGSESEVTRCCDGGSEGHSIGKATGSSGVELTDFSNEERT